MSVSYVAHTRLKTQTLPISSVYFSHLFHKDHHTMQRARIGYVVCLVGLHKDMANHFAELGFQTRLFFLHKKGAKISNSTCLHMQDNSFAFSKKSHLLSEKKKGIKIGLSIIFIVHTIWFFETSYFTELQLIKMSKSAQYTISHKTTKENAIL